MAKRVAIIGAGISGLLACKYTIASGYSPIVFETDDQVGGLWNHTLETTKLQSPKDAFKFSDFPWPSTVEEIFPLATHLLEYLKSYAKHFDLLRYIKFNTEVKSIDYVGESDEEMESWELWGGNGKAFGSKGKWILEVVDVKNGSTKEYEAEFVVLCIGKFSGLPNVPDIEGSKLFTGKTLHSMEFSNMDNVAAAKLLKGKRVVIIGSGKSAIDVAYECALANGNGLPCAMVFRSIPWMLPYSKIWGIGFEHLVLTRFFEMLHHKPGGGIFNSILATLLYPLRSVISKFVESYLRWKFPLKKYNLIPKEDFVQHVGSAKILFLQDNFYDKVEEGSIILKKVRGFRFYEDGLMLDGDERLKADIVIFATGYKGDQKLMNIFARPSFRNSILGSPSSVIPLYRQMIHPRIPQLAVIGYSESINNIYTFEMRCKWLKFFLDQAFELPSIKKMELDAEEWGEYFKKYTGENEHRRACIGATHTWYNDQLCKDIGCNPRRKKGFFTDMFEPYGVNDYDGLAPQI